MYHVSRFARYISHSSFSLLSSHFSPLLSSLLSALRLSSASLSPLLIAGLLTLFIIQPLLQPGLPAGADVPIHLYRTFEYGQAWSAGVIVPRWAPDLAFGYGYPLFVFTPPLTHWLILAFHQTGLTLETAFKALIILTILVYAIGMYLFARDTLGSVEAGLVASVAYTFAPFALREALLYGGNLPQFLAIGLFPWTLWAMTRAAYRRSWFWTIAVASFYAGVMLSHLFQVLVLTPIVVLYGLLLWWGIGVRGRGLGVREQVAGSSVARVSLNTLRPLLASRLSPLFPLLCLPLGLLLSAFFWLPAFVERFYTRAQADIYLQRSPFYVRYPTLADLTAWIYPLDARAANPYVPLTLGVVTLALAVFGLLAGFGLIFKKQTSPLSSLLSASRLSSVFAVYFFALAATIAIFLSLPVSRPVWETITILQVAEFPWRFLGLANLGLAGLAGAAILLLPPKIRPYLTAVCLIVQIVAVAPFLYPVTPFTRYGEITLADQVNYERRSQSIGTTTLGEYMPKTVTRTFTGSPLVKAFQAGQNPPRLDPASLPLGATASLLEQTAVAHVYRLNSPVDFTLRLWQFDYPGWQADLDDQPISIRPEADTGFILIDLPAGEHTLTARFGETPLRLASLLVSGVTVLGLMIVGVYQALKIYRSGRQERQEQIKNPGDLARPGQTPRQSRVLYGSIVFGAGLIVAALWLKPLLRPVFTIQSPPDQALPAQRAADIRFANGIRLLGYDLEKTVVEAGGRMQVVLYWQTDTALLRVNLQPFVHLDRLNDGVTVADATNYTPGDATTESVLPTFHWDTARYVRDEHDLLLPSDTRPIAYAVRVGLIDPAQRQLVALASGSGDTARLTIINVSSPGEPPRLTQPLNVSFKNNIDTLRLTGFQLDSLTPARLDFSLSWQSNRRPQKDYIIFAQLLDSDQNLAAGFDRQPLDGAYPTSTWLPGQTIVDPRYIPVAGVVPGDYQLIIGLYDPATQQRLTTSNGADFVELTKLQIADGK